MPDCCTPGSPRYENVFDQRFAHEVATRYRRRGLTPHERTIVEHLASVGIAGRSVLEVGGGVGEIQLELLMRGLRHATNLELSGAYEVEARALLDERGIGERVTRRIGVDLAEQGHAVDGADYVILHRVVCCYPDAARLLLAAAAHARRALVFSHPPRIWLTRTTVGLSNAMMHLHGREYRGFVHAPDIMYDTLRRAGLDPVPLRKGPRWWVVAAQRT